MADEPVAPDRMVTGRRRELTVGPLRARLRSWMPPIERREFWAVQILVLLVAVLHFVVEHQHLLDDHSPIYLLPTTLFLVPVIYAALNFGRRGAVLTALWATILVAPNVAALHDPIEGIGELTQVVWITAVAVFVGGRVDRERSARQEAEYREARQRESEQRYRSIVNNVGEPILVLDAERRVIDANDAAAALLGDGRSGVRGERLRGAVGETLRAWLEDADRDAQAARLRLGGPARWYEPIVMQTGDAHGGSRTQILLVDVTASIEREQGLESITRSTIAAREEERRRVSRELHDGPLQSLVALWRDLDAISSGMDGPQREQLLRARRSTEDVADELRRFSRELRPSVLDDLGIAAALRAEAERTADEWQLDVGVDAVGTPRRMGTDTEITLLRIAQEALRNVTRHAEAKTASVVLEFGPPGVRLRIGDDGRGIDPMPTSSELLSGSHLGIIGMRERARMAGGSLQLRRASLGGLEVVVEIPEASVGDAPGERFTR